MKIFIAASILVLSSFMGYISFTKYKNALTFSNFLTKFTVRLIHDYQFEMSGIVRVFSEEYINFFGEDLGFDKSSDVFSYIKNKHSEFKIPFDYYYALIKLCSSGADELEDNIVQLSETVKNNDRYILDPETIYWRILNIKWSGIYF